MRLKVIQCILLACITTSFAVEENTRNKRDLVFLKKLLSSALFGYSNKTESVPAASVIFDDGNVKIFRIPGHDNILVKAVPKVRDSIIVNTVPEIVEVTPDVPKTVVEVDPSIAVLESYLGTKNREETLCALQKMKNLMQLGILDAKPVTDKFVYIVPPFRPELVKVAEPPPVSVIHKPQKVPLVPVIAPPVLPPAPIMPDIIPVKPITVPDFEPIAILPEVETKYLYKQIKNDGSLITYSSKNGGDVIVKEIKNPMQLPSPPPYIMERFDKILIGFPKGTMPVPGHASSILTRKPAVYDIPFTPVEQHVAPLFEPSVNALKVNPYRYQEHYAGQGRVDRLPAKVIVQDSFLMPPPPTYIVDRIEKVAAAPSNLPKAPKGYSFKTVNNNGYIKYGDEKIPVGSFDNFSQHLLPNPYAFAKIENSPMFDMKDEVSVKVNNHETNSNAPIGSPNVLSAHGAGKYSYKQFYPNFNRPSVPIPMMEPPRLIPDLLEKKTPKFVFKQNPHVSKNIYMLNVEDKSRFDLKGNYTEKVNGPSNLDGNGVPYTNSNIPLSSNSYSYTQIENGSPIKTYLGNRDVTLVVTESSKIIPTPPLHSVDSVERVATVTYPPKSPNISSAYSFKITNNESVVNMGGTVITSSGVKQQPSSPVSGITTKGEIPSTYSYKQVNKDGVLSTYTGHNKELQNSPVFTSHNVNNMENGVTIQSPTPSAAYSFKITNNQAAGVVKNHNSLKGEIHTPQRTVFLGGPIPSSYVYKQVSQTQTNGLKGDIYPRINKHEHIRSDGTKYFCEEVHTLPSLVQNIELLPKITKDYFYVPSVTADEMPLPTTHKTEKPEFSGQQVTNYRENSSLKSSQTITSVKSTTIPSLSRNPIVVAPVREDILENNGENLVSVKEEMKNTKPDSSRGDIPEALS